MNPQNIWVRRGRPEDTPAMLDITRNIWEGDDYVPSIWDTWLNDAMGILQIATMDGEVIGFQHIGIQPDGSAWVEGIRVREDLRGRGAGRELLQSGVEWARSRACGTIRLSTSNTNEASNRIAERVGFRLVGKFLCMEAPPSSQEVTIERVRIVPATDIDAAWEFVQAQNTSGAFGFYTEGWTVYRLTKSRLAFLLAMHSVACTRVQNRISAMAIGTYSMSRPAVRLGYLVGEQDGAADLAAWMRRRAGDAKVEKVRTTVYVTDQVADALQTSGYTGRPGVAMRLYQLEPRNEATTAS